MRTIYKFPLVIGEVNKVRVPDGSVVRMVANQRGNVTLWIEVDPHANTVERHYVIFGTGSPIDAGACYVGSCIVDPYVWYCPVCEWAGGMDGDTMKRVQVCPECGLPVVWTFMFAGAEWHVYRV